MSENPSQEPLGLEPRPAVSPAPRLPHAFPYIPIKVVDARSPCPTLATTSLNATPRPGDMITLDLGGRRVRYRIEFVNFDPNENIQVELRCVPEELGTAPQSNPAKIDEYIQAQEQAFQKDKAYSKTIITLGYAGLFGIWAFVNPHLSHKAILTTALLAGFPL